MKFNPIYADITLVIVVLVAIAYFITEVIDLNRSPKERLQAACLLAGLIVLLILFGGLIGKDLALM